MATKHCFIFANLSILRLMVEHIKRSDFRHVIFPEKCLEALILGKAFQSYRMALEFEIERWKPD